MNISEEREEYSRVKRWWSNRGVFQQTVVVIDTCERAAVFCSRCSRVPEKVQGQSLQTKLDVARGQAEGCARGRGYIIAVPFLKACHVCQSSCAKRGRRCCFQARRGGNHWGCALWVKTSEFPNVLLRGGRLSARRTGYALTEVKGVRGGNGHVIVSLVNMWLPCMLWQTAERGNLHDMRLWHAMHSSR